LFIALNKIIFIKENLKFIPSIIIACCLFQFFLAGCNSKAYEIEEVEDTTSTTPTAEIKQEIEKSKSEIKEETTKVPKKTIMIYSIQIGAFEEESNAIDFTASSKKILNYDINFSLIEGLYKVRFGNYYDKDEVNSILDKVKNLGFSDAFIIQTTK